MITLAFYLIGLTIAASLHMAWFDTPTFAVLVSKALRTQGWHKDIPDFWPDDATYKEWSHGDWETWVAISLHEQHPILSDLVMCPICLSFHISFWVGIVLVFAGAPFWFPFMVALSWPVLINIIHSKFLA